MYAVSKDGVGLIAGTLAYSRKAAIEHFMFGESILRNWEEFKRTGYRTVMARVQIIRRGDVGSSLTPEGKS
jgi:hypothetical protein